MPPTRERRWWTSQEDEVLKAGVQSQYGNVQNWNDIAVLLPGRTNKDCRKRWSKVQRDIKKGAWTRDEDERLQQAIQQLGFKWSQVATMVQTRNADQCAKRWQHVLGPDFKHSPWTPEEDSKLVEAMTRHGNNWKQIELADLPDRSTHDIRNRSLLLGRRSRNILARTASTQPPSPCSNEDDGAGDGLDEDDDDADADGDASDGGSGGEYTGLVRPHHAHEPSGMQRERMAAPESRINSPGTTHFQQPHALEIPQDAGPFFDSDWTGATGQAQTYSELPTPSSDCLSWFEPFETTTSATFGPEAPWWAKDPMGEHYFHHPEPVDLKLHDMPGRGGDPRGTGHAESHGGNITWYNEKRGSVTLTLNQVDPDVAQEIMGSVLKHSGGLKIQCIVNDD